MDNENLNNEEELEVTEPIEEANESVSEEVAEDTAEAAAEVSENAAEGESLMNEFGENGEISAEMIAIPQSGNAAKVVAVVCGVIVILLVAVAAIWNTGIVNPYEKGYIDISGVTLKDLADSNGFSVSEYKKMNGLPWLMPKSTNENAVKNYVTIEASLAQSGTDFKSLKEYYGWDDSITEKTTVGKALGETKLSIILGVKDMDEDTANQTLDALKEFYGFGDEVTLDTLYKDVRQRIDEKTKEKRLEQEQEEAEKNEDAEKSDDAEDKADDTDAEKKNGEEKAETAE